MAVQKPDSEIAMPQHVNEIASIAPDEVCCSQSSFTDQRDARDTDVHPTAEVYHYWSGAFDFWNASLFGSTLPKVVIVMSRRPRLLGYYRPRAMSNRAKTVVGEIALNPQYFHIGDKEAHSVLVHEMAHLWRDVLGERNAKGGRGSRGYHDRFWGRRMIEMGLMPSHTGEPGGRQTGTQMMHYIIEGGAFDRAFTEFRATHNSIDWKDSTPIATVAPTHGIERELDKIGLGDRGTEGVDAKPKPKDRVKFTCRCGLNAWAKPTARLVCGFCHEAMQSDCI